MIEVTETKPAMPAPAQPVQTECPECQVKIEQLMVAMGIAHFGCEMVKDEEQKRNCTSWLDKIDPATLESARAQMKENIEKFGVDVVDNYATNVYQLSKYGIIDVVGEKLARRAAGENVEITEREMELYKIYTNEDGV